jgi:membrane protease YdiL (CAAX protease family)
MTSPPAAIVSTAAIDPISEISVAEKRQRWFEVCLVLLVAFGSNILYALYLLIYGPGASAPYTNFRWVTGIVHEASTLLLLGYVLSRRGRKFAALGLQWSLRNVGIGLLLAAVSYVVTKLGRTLVYDIRYLVYGAIAHGPTGRDFFAHPSIAAIPFTLLNPFFEELIVRAYVMTEVMELTGSSILAVVLSVSIQFSYHLYYGWAGAISLSFIFLVLALYYARSRNALPIVVAHGYFDISAMLRLIR